MFKTRSLGLKIALTIIAIVIGMLLIVGVILGVSMNNVSRSLIDSNEAIGKTSRTESLFSITEQTQTRLMELAEGKADMADVQFMELKKAVENAAALAEQLYAHPEAYSARDIPLPDASLDGTLSVQLLASANTNLEDPAIVSEIGLLGNLQDALMVLNESNESLASIYVASESGIMVQADWISGRKFDEKGQLMPMEAKERPWYQGAAESGETFFTPVTRDAHTPRLAIMCGVPVYREGELAAVAGGGMYLDAIDSLVQSIELGETGNACIINRSGRVLFSTFEEGVLAAVTDGEDIRLNPDQELSSIADEASSGKKSVGLAEVNGQVRYVAYAPMKTVGWSFMILLTKDEVERPALQLDENLKQLSDQAMNDAYLHLNRTIMLLIIVLGVAILIAFLVSIALSNHIVKPIEKLTEEVKSLEGDDLDFTWDMDTKDETQQLASSFQSLTERMKTYITDLKQVTADKERMETELSLATRIQEGMLETRFPAFPDRKDFDLYAQMDPAKEVGGDFYDFFLIDEDHLALVMADVSGKGIPAALFMMASKIILANNAMMGKDPAEILLHTNMAICSRNQEQMFVTVWLGILELSTGKLTASNAGHEYPVLKEPDGEYRLVKEPHGCAIGGFDDSTYENYEWQLEPGTKLFVYTDGVAEAMNSQRELFGTGRLVEALNENPDLPPQQVLEAVRGAVDRFVGEEPQFDDLTMLSFEYKGPAS